MLCPKCDRANIDGARFCDTCGTVLSSVDASTTAAIGPTARLDEPPNVAEPSTALPSAVPIARHGRVRRLRQMNGGLWLIGIGVLFLTGTFWPGILVLVGISGYLEETARGRQQEAVRTLVFAVGLAVLFGSGWFWPGILILVGLTTLLSPEVRPRHA